MGEGKDKDEGQKEEKKKREKKKEDLEKREIDQEDLLGLGDAPAEVATPVQSQSGKGNAYDDLLGIGINDEVVTPTPGSSHQGHFGFAATKSPAGSMNDFMDLAGGSSAYGIKVKQPAFEIVLPRMQSGMSGKNGVEIWACVQRSGDGLALHLSFRSMVQMMVGVNYINIMQNSLGIGCNYARGSCLVPPAGNQDLLLPLTHHFHGGSYTSMLNLQVGTSYDEYMLMVPVYPHILGNSSRPVTIEEFKQGWMNSQQISVDQPLIPPLLNNEEQLKQLFRDNGIIHLSTQNPGGNKKYYFGSRLETNEMVFLELTVPSPNMLGGYQIVSKSSSAALTKPFVHSLIYLLK